MNDAIRWDGRQDFNCASIAFPNAPMFYSYMQSEPQVKWPILVLSPAVLTEKEVLFCKHNAADKRISSQPDALLREFAAFRGMFAELEGIASRSDQGLKACDPTDVQAEILIRGTIEPKYIKALVFPDNATKQEFKYKIGQRPSLIDDRTGLYGNRIYYRKWGQGK